MDEYEKLARFIRLLLKFGCITTIVVIIGTAILLSLVY